MIGLSSSKRLAHFRSTRGLRLLLAAVLVAGCTLGTILEIRRSRHVLRTNARLETVVFPTEGERAFFMEWASMAGGIEIRFEPREAFASRGMRPFEAKDVAWKPNGTFCIPLDLKCGELVGMITGLQKATFGGAIGEQAVIWQVMETLRQEPRSFFYRSQCRTLLPSLHGFAPSTKRVAALPGEDIGMQLRIALFKAFFQLGLRNLALRMPSFSLRDFAALRVEEQQEYPHLISQLDDTGILIRDKVALETLKSQLQAARKSQKVEEVVSLELNAIDRLLDELETFPWQRALYGPDGFAPARLIDSRRTLCLGKTYILTSLLQELGISLKAAAFPQHVATLVTLADRRDILVDPTSAKHCALPPSSQRVGTYLYFPGLDLNQAYRGSDVLPVLDLPETDSALMTEMLVSWGFDEYIEWTFTNGALLPNPVSEKRLAWAERCFRLALEIIPNHGAAWQGLGKVLEGRGESTQAIQAYEQAIRRNPLDVRSSTRLIALFQERGSTIKIEEEKRRLQAAQEQWADILPFPKEP